MHVYIRPHYLNYYCLMIQCLINVNSLMRGNTFIFCLEVVVNSQKDEYCHITAIATENQQCTALKTQMYLELH